jgi:ribulose-5-phosphate 4-epimerase/fuculose-1-phosphate aldolase
MTDQGDGSGPEEDASVVASNSEGRARFEVARACRMLVVAGVLGGVLGHVSLRRGADELLIRCRGPRERGLRFSEPEDVHGVGFDGRPPAAAGYRAPHELPIHTAVLEARQDLNAVVHAHSPYALLAGLADLELPAMFGAYDIPAARLAEAEIPVYPRSVLINDAALASELVHAMGSANVCLLRGHGIVAAGADLKGAVVAATNLETLARVAVQLRQLGAAPRRIDDRDLAQLPDLGQGFNDGHSFNHLAALLQVDDRVRGLDAMPRRNEAGTLHA